MHDHIFYAGSPLTIPANTLLRYVEKNALSKDVGTPLEIQIKATKYLITETVWYVIDITYRSIRSLTLLETYTSFTTYITSRRIGSVVNTVMYRVPASSIKPFMLESPY